MSLVLTNYNRQHVAPRPQPQRKEKRRPDFEGDLPEERAAQAPPKKKNREQLEKQARENRQKDIIPTDAEIRENIQKQKIDMVKAKMIKEKALKKKHDLEERAKKAVATKERIENVKKVKNPKVNCKLCKQGR